MFAHGVSIALLFALAGSMRERLGTLDFEKLGGSPSRFPDSACSSVSEPSPRSACRASRISRPRSRSSSAPLPERRRDELDPLGHVGALWGVVISAVNMLRAYRTVFMGPKPEKLAVPADFSWNDRLPLLLLLIALLAVGFAPELLNQYIRPAVTASPRRGRLMRRLTTDPELRPSPPCRSITSNSSLSRLVSPCHGGCLRQAGGQAIHRPSRHPGAGGCFPSPFTVEQPASTEGGIWKFYAAPDKLSLSSLSRAGRALHAPRSRHGGGLPPLGRRADRQSEPGAIPGRFARVFRPSRLCLRRTHVDGFGHESRQHLRFPRDRLESRSTSSSPISGATWVPRGRSEVSDSRSPLDGLPRLRVRLALRCHRGAWIFRDPDRPRESRGEPDCGALRLRPSSSSPSPSSSGRLPSTCGSRMFTRSSDSDHGLSFGWLESGRGHRDPPPRDAFLSSPVLSGRSPRSS